MPKRKKSTESVGTEEVWIPTRAPYLVDNPFAGLTKEEAYAKQNELYAQLHRIQYEIDQVGRIVLSYNVMYFDADGNVCRAV